MASTQPSIYVAGHRGMVGSAILRHLLADGHPPDSILTRTHAELDLINQSAAGAFFLAEKPTHVYLAAAKVGGIHANNIYPADFIYQNLMMQANVIEAAFQSGVKKLLFLGSSCIYPRQALQPMGKSALLTGPLESTNEPYAIAKSAGFKLCADYNRQYCVSQSMGYHGVMLTNFYGIDANYNSENPHVVPSLIYSPHYKIEQPQGKPGRVVKGKFFHVAVYIRKDSRTFGISVTVDLSEGNQRQLKAPPKLSLNFLVTSESTDFLDKTAAHYSPNNERCILWGDLSVNIQWPFSNNGIARPKLSTKDLAGTSLSEI